MVQAAASYGDQNPTGRRPGYRRWSSPITGSSSPTPGNPEPSTSSDKIRSTCGRTSATRSAPGLAGLTLSAWYPQGGAQIELEPIGPRERLKPGESASFTEDWWLLPHPFPKKGQQLDLKALAEQVMKQTTETR